MPIGIQRINAQRPQPSSQIIFIKPLPGPDQKYAQDFLERIAAICHPIMKANHLSIMTLEEHEPNPEFIGRNFNAGEIIQLVLKAPYTGHWLSFKSVQIVMMHELAHCLQMNHAGAFWKVNNQFKGELKELWRKGYAGDGLWGRGQTLLSGEYHTGSIMENEVLPANLCGGTFRSSRRGKRKRAVEKPKETYAERQQRRIKKKFGMNGTALGDDESRRVKLENGKKPKGKPKVAGSARGRELRAAAALARFDQVQEEQLKEEDRKELDDSETESEGSNTEGEKEAVNADGSRMRDVKGRGLIKVCEGEDQDDIDVKREIEELQRLNNNAPSPRPDDRTVARQQQASKHSQPQSRATTNQANISASGDSSHFNLYDIPLYVEKKEVPVRRKPNINTPPTKSQPTDHVGAHLAHVFASGPPNSPLPSTSSWENHHHEQPSTSEEAPTPQPPTRRSPLPSPLTKPSPSPSPSPSPIPTSNPSNPTETTCPICSMTNEYSAHLCIACSHVLDTQRVTRYWRCQSDSCRGSEYINAIDCGVCGICGSRRGGEG